MPEQDEKPKNGPTQGKLPEPKAAAEPESVKIDHATLKLIATVLAQTNAAVHRPVARREDADTTVPGGKYVVGGEEVSAWGTPYVEGQDPAKLNPEAPKSFR